MMHHQMRNTSNKRRLTIQINQSNIESFYLNDDKQFVERFHLDLIKIRSNTMILMCLDFVRSECPDLSDKRIIRWYMILRDLTRRASDGATQWLGMC